MAQERPTTPEKQLLKLIEDPKAEGLGIQAHAIKHRSLGLFSFSAWIGRFSFFKDKIVKSFKGGELPQLDVKTVNMIMILGIFALGIYLVSNITMSITNSKKMPDVDFGIQKGQEFADVGKASLLKAASYYLEKVKERNIFEIGEKKEIEQPKEVADKTKLPSQKTMEVIQNLKLVGISWSDNPDAMIEDTRSMRTFFVKRGETIGDIKIQAIFKDKVVLNCAGEEVELK